MTGTGNDIVALGAINVARTKQPNFYSKIIIDRERALYEEHLRDQLPFELFVWLAWSVKESVYKLLQQSEPGMVFSPSNIIVTTLGVPAKEFEGQLEGRDFDDTAYQGVISFGDHLLYARSVITADFIFSAANDKDDFTDTCWGIRRIGSAAPADQSKAVREFLLNRLNSIYPDAELSVAKNQHNIPELFNGAEKMAIPISLAHHDHYIAYSFQLK